MKVEYHEVSVDMEFEEQARLTGGRLVRVARAMTYSCDCLILSGRGAGKTVRVFRKQLVDPRMWLRRK